MSHAEETLIKHVQEEMRTDVDKGKYKKLLPTTENGIIVVGGRAEKWISSTWNREKFILLPAKHRLSVLIAEKAHVDSGHLAVEATIASYDQIEVLDCWCKENGEINNWEMQAL